MTKRELDNLLSKGTPFYTVLLFGQFSYHCDLYAQKILNNIPQPKEVLKLYFDEYNFEKAKNHIAQNSLFGDELALHVKMDKKIPKQELLSLANTAAKHKNKFIYEYVGDFASKDKDYYESITQAQNAHFVRFFAPNSQDEWLHTVKAVAIENRVEISNSTIEELLRLVNYDMGLCASELKKLSILSRPIENHDLHLLVAASGDVAMEKLFDEIVTKRPFLPTLEQLLGKGEEEIAIALAFQSYIYKLFMFFLHIKAYGQSDPKKVLGYFPPTHIVQAMEKKATSLDIYKYKSILEILFELDYLLKFEKCDKTALLLASFMKIKSCL